MAEFQGIQFKITASASGASKSITSLAEKLKTLKTQLGSFDTYFATTQIRDLGDAARSAASYVTTLGFALKAMNPKSDFFGRLSDQFVSEVDQFIAKSKEMQANMMNTENAMSGQTGGASSATKNVNSLRTAFEGLGSTLGRIGKKGLTGVGHLFRDIGKLASAGITKSIKSLGDRFSNLTGKIRQFGKSIARIAMYRAIRSVIKGITNAMKEGTQNLYQYSKAMGTDFHISMDSISTDALYLKNAFATIAAPIINAVAPAFRALTDAVVEAMNTVAQFFAVLTGASTWTRAVRSAKEYGDNLNSAGGAAKKLKDYTLGIDELNVFNDNGSSGGGGAADAADYLSMFEEAVTDSALVKFVDELKKKIADGDWRGVGESIGQKVNSAINGIQWENVGKTIAGKLNNAISLWLGISETVNFKQIGTNFANLIKGALEAIDANQFGRAVASTVFNLLDVAIGFATELPYGTIGDDIGKFLKGALQAGSDWFKRTDFAEIGKKIVGGISTMITQLTQSGVAGDFATFLTDALNAAGDLLEGAIANGDFYDLIDSINQFFNELIENIDGEMLIAGLGKVLLSIILGGLDLALSSLTAPFKLIADNLEKKFGENNPISQFFRSIVNGMEYSEDAWAGAKSEIFDWYDETFMPKREEPKAPTTPVTAMEVSSEEQRMREATSSAKTTAKEVANEIGGVYGQELQMRIASSAPGVEKSMTTPITGGTQKSTQSMQKMATDFDTNLQKVSNNTSKQMGDTGKSIGDKVTTGKTNAISALGLLVSGATTKFTSLNTTTREKLNTTKNYLKDKIKDGKTSAIGFLGSLVSDARTKFTTLNSTTREKLNTTKGYLKNKIKDGKTSAIGFLESLITDAKKKFDDLNLATSEKMGTVESTMGTTASNMKKKITDQNWFQVGIDLLLGLNNGLNDTTTRGKVNQTAAGIGTGLTGIVKSVNLIQSPSRVWADIGRFLDMGLIVGLESKSGEVMNTAESLALDMNKSFSDNSELFYDADSIERQFYDTGIGSMIGAIGDKASSGYRDAVEGVASTVGLANETIVQAIETLISVVQEKDVSVSIGDEQVGRANDRYRNKRGAYISTGAFQNSY